MRRWVWRVLLIAAAALALTGSALAADQVTLSNGVVLEDEAGKWTVTGYTGNGGSVTIPEVYQGKAITKIAARAFQSKAGKKITEVIIPASILDVGEEAFAQCGQLGTVIFKDETNNPAGAMGFSIGKNAFQVCGRLSVLSLPQNRPAYIQTGAFKGCGELNNVILWNGTVDSGAFALCDKLKMVTVAEKAKLTSCTKDAFDDKTLEVIHFMGNTNDAVTGWLWSRSHFVADNVVRNFDDADCTEEKGEGKVVEKVRCDVQDCTCSFERELIIPALEHDYTEPPMPNDYSACATWVWKYDAVCSRCKETVHREITIEGDGKHNFKDADTGTITEEPTCDKEGTKVFQQTCQPADGKKCDAEQTRKEPIPKLTTHTYTGGKTSEYIIWPATCSKEKHAGFAAVYKICDVCGEMNTCEQCKEYQKDLEFYRENGLSDGELSVMQSYENHIRTVTHPGGVEPKDLDQLKHTRPEGLEPDPEKSKPVTCTEDGENVYPEYVCTICGETVPEGEKEKLLAPEGGHNWSKLNENDPRAFKKQPTCTEPGEKLKNPKICYNEGCGIIEGDKDENGKEIIEIVDALGHQWGSPVLVEGTPYKPATCTEPGEGTGTITCTREGCHSDPKDPKSPPASQTGKLTLPALGHDWGEWKNVKEPTATDSGTQERVCQREGCGEKETRTLPPLDAPDKPDDPDNPDKPDDPDKPTTKPEDKTYKVDVVQASNGVTTVSRSTAKQGDLVTVTVSPSSGYVLDMIRVISSSQALSLTDLGGGQYRFTMPAADVEVRATYDKTGADYGSNWSEGFGNSGNGKRTDPRRTTDSLPAQIQEQPAPQAVTDQRMFSDVPTYHWAAAQINWASQMGYMSGSGGRFDPDGLITAQQMWMVLARLTGSSPATMTEARRWAELGGYADGSSPTGPVKRHQLVTALYRCARLTGRTGRVPASLSGFPDSRTVPTVAREAFTWALSRGVVNTDSEGRIKPNENLTRAQFAVILYSYSYT